MASNLKYKTSVKNAMLDAITSAVATSGEVRIYSGTQPASPDASLSGNTLLAALACSVAFAASAASGVLTANSITPDASADNTGTATWGSIVKSDGTRIVDFSVGTSGADLNLNTVNIVSGAQVSISGLTITGAN